MNEFEKFLKMNDRLALEATPINDCDDMDAFMQDKNLDKSKGISSDGYEYKFEPLGGDSGSYSDVSATNEVAFLALREKFVNSNDAILEKYHAETDLDSYQKMMSGLTDEISDEWYKLPQSQEEAIDRYMKDIDLANSNSSECCMQIHHTKNSETRTISIQDFGMGQTPKGLEDNLFYKSKASSKLRNSYLTGRHKKGAKGILNCMVGRKYQLIASKMAPHLSKISNDPHKDLWSFSISQVIPFDELSSFGLPMMRNHEIVYLKFKVGDDWLVPMCSFSEFPISYPSRYRSLSKFSKPKYGTYMKIYNFDFHKGIGQLSSYRKQSGGGLFHQKNSLFQIKNYINYTNPSFVTPIKLVEPERDIAPTENWDKKSRVDSETAHGFEKAFADKVDKKQTELVFDQTLTMNKDKVFVKCYFTSSDKITPHTKHSPRSGVVIKIFNNLIFYTHRYLQRQEIAMNSISDNLLVFFDFNNLPMKDRLDAVQTNKEKLSSDTKIHDFITYGFQQIKADGRILELLRQSRLNNFKADFKKHKKRFLSEKIFKNINRSSHELGSVVSNTPRNLNNSLTDIVLDDRGFRHFAHDKNDPSNHIPTKFIGDNLKSFKIYFEHDAKRNVFHKAKPEASVFFSKDGDDWIKEEDEFYSSFWADGAGILTIAPPCNFSNTTFFLKINISFQSKDWEFIIPCLSTNIDTKNSAEEPKTKRQKKPLGKDLEVIKLYNLNDMKNFIVQQDDDEDKCIDMNESHCVGFDSLDRIGVNLNHPSFKKIIKRKNLTEEEKEIYTLHYMDYIKFQTQPMLDHAKKTGEQLTLYWHNINLYASAAALNNWAYQKEFEKES